jgi:hypothetical protein
MRQLKVKKIKCIALGSRHHKFKTHTDTLHHRYTLPNNIRVRTTFPAPRYTQLYHSTIMSISIGIDESPRDFAPPSPQAHIHPRPNSVSVAHAQLWCRRQVDAWCSIKLRQFVCQIQELSVLTVVTVLLVLNVSALYDLCHPTGSLVALNTDYPVLRYSHELDSIQQQQDTAQRFADNMEVYKAEHMSQRHASTPATHSVYELLDRLGSGDSCRRMAILRLDIPGDVSLKRNPHNDFTDDADVSWNYRVNRNVRFDELAHTLVYAVLAAASQNRTLIVDPESAARFMLHKATGNHRACTGFECVLQPVSKCEFSPLFKDNAKQFDWYEGGPDQQHSASVVLIDGVVPRPPSLSFILESFEPNVQQYGLSRLFAAVHAYVLTPTARTAHHMRMLKHIKPIMSGLESGSAAIGVHMPSLGDESDVSFLPFFSRIEMPVEYGEAAKSDEPVTQTHGPGDPVRDFAVHAVAEAVSMQSLYSHLLSLTATVSTCDNDLAAAVQSLMATPAKAIAQLQREKADDKMLDADSPGQLVVGVDQADNDDVYHSHAGPNTNEGQKRHHHTIVPKAGDAVQPIATISVPHNVAFIDSSLSDDDIWATRTDRQSTYMGVVDTLVDVWILSRSRALIGSCMSPVSRMAASLMIAQHHKAIPPVAMDRDYCYRYPFHSIPVLEGWKKPRTVTTA